MIALAIVIVVLVLLLLATSFLLGYVISDRKLTPFIDPRLEAARAEQRIHRIAAEAFEALARRAGESWRGR